MATFLGRCKVAVSVTRFFEFLGNKYFYKSSPTIMVTFWAFLNNTTFMENIIWLLFWAIMGKIGQLFTHHQVTLVTDNHNSQTLGSKNWRCDLNLKL